VANGRTYAIKIRSARATDGSRALAAMEDATILATDDALLAASRSDLPSSRVARAFEHAYLQGMEVKREYRNASTAYAYVRAR